ncbi:MAG: BCD family MFS transporter [Pseudanabaenaceae cyanobacterium bins.68]|nr:BCD family MFS transporter [Pseudanabaenaceae cyanobacterium bins.68]
MSKLPIATMFRLGLFQLGLGMMSLLTLGLLNRVMINELGVPAAIAALVIAMPLFVAPARVWFGQISDAKLFWGSRRTGYVWAGALCFSLASFGCVQLVWQFGNSLQGGWNFNTWAWLAALAGGFSFYGLSLSASSTPFAALLVDITDQEQRPKLVGIVWSLLMVGIVIGAIAISRVLPCTENLADNFNIYSSPNQLAALQAGVNRVFVIIPVVVLGLALISLWGIEAKYSRLQPTEQSDLGLPQAIRVLTASPQTGVFFGFLVLMTISLFMQDAVMEPYGGRVFGMGICATTQLNAFFGMGTLIGISGGGFVIVPRLGKQGATQAGCWGAGFCCGLLILAGINPNINLLKASLFLFGLSSGVLTAGATSLMLDLTATATAGTFIGAWGLAQAIARGGATVLGGVFLDLGRSWLGEGLAAYGLVFSLEAIGLIGAAVLLNRVDIQQFRANATTAIAQVLSQELD